jgi:hypothetical protein|tara:strand:+ start:48 stop:257 length:210 start_codon:yes stop_codon:yes gene_type:complete
MARHLLQKDKTVISKQNILFLFRVVFQDIARLTAVKAIAIIKIIEAEPLVPSLIILVDYKDRFQQITFV